MAAPEQPEGNLSSSLNDTTTLTCQTNDHGSVQERTDPDWRSASENPRNWPKLRRWTILCLMAIVTFLAMMAATAFEPAIPRIMEDFGSNNSSLASLTLSIYLLGYCVGPMFIAPISELYGRAPVLWMALPSLLVSLTGAGSSVNIVMFMVFRILGGVALVAIVLLGNALVADMTTVESRGAALGIMLSGPSIGPALGPITGGYVAEHIGWKWIFWIYLIVTGPCSVLMVIVYRESYGPVLKQKWSQRIKNRSAARIEQNPLDKRTILRNAWTRPFKVLIRSPITMLIAFVSSIANGYFVLALATLGTVFQKAYSFSVPQSGLAYLGMVAGFALSQATAGYITDRQVRIMQAKNGETKPEHRLPLLVLGASTLPAGFLVYGWAVEYQLHWMVPILGSTIIAMGVMYSFMPCQMYLIDSFTLYAVSATGAAGILRSIVGAVLPLAGNPLYGRMGYGWGNSLLALIALTNVPIALFLLKKGEVIRARSDRCID